MVLTCTWLALGTNALNAETLFGSNNDSRITIALEAKAGPLQGMLPKGWTLVPFPSGALEGANTVVVLVDRFLARDAEGSPAGTPVFRGAALVSLGKQKDSEETRMFALGVYATDPEYDPYGNAAFADIRRSATLESSGTEPPYLTEAWTVALEDGGELSFDLSYRSGVPSWSTSDGYPYSNVNPDFYRIYKYDQLADLAMSAPLERSLNGDMTFDASIAELDGVFDGSERIVAVVVAPMYVRDVYLP